MPGPRDVPYGLFTLLTGLLVLLGIGLAVVAHGRPPPGSAYPPAPPPAGQHGDVRLRLTGGLSPAAFDLRVSADGAYTTESGRPGGSAVRRSGRLSPTDRSALAAAVGKTCRTRLLADYPDVVYDGFEATVTFCGSTVRLWEGSDEPPSALRTLVTLLDDLARRLSAPV
jgi:hypothetical protein